MSDFNIATRYANALMELSEEKNIFEKVANDVETIYKTLFGSKDLQRILSNPIIDNQKKKSILQELFSNHLGIDTLNFVMFVVEKNREEYLYSISKRFLELKDQKLGFANVEIKSAVELSDDQKNNLKTRLSKLTGKEVKLSYKIDESVLGGFVARIGDTVMDASVLQQLKSLKQKFSEEYSVLN